MVNCEFNVPTSYALSSGTLPKVGDCMFDGMVYETGDEGNHRGDDIDMSQQLLYQSQLVLFLQ